MTHISNDKNKINVKTRAVILQISIKELWFFVSVFSRFEVIYHTKIGVNISHSFKDMLKTDYVTGKNWAFINYVYIFVLVAELKEKHKLMNISGKWYNDQEKLTYLAQSSFHGAM